jgi:hypothetical protein
MKLLYPIGYLLLVDPTLLLSLPDRKVTILDLKRFGDV